MIEKLAAAKNQFIFQLLNNISDNTGLCEYIYVNKADLRRKGLAAGQYSLRTLRNYEIPLHKVFIDYSGKLIDWKLPKGDSHPELAKLKKQRRKSVLYGFKMGEMV